MCNIKIFILIIVGTVAISRAMEQGDDADALLAPNAQRQLLTLAQQEPGSFKNLILLDEFDESQQPGVDETAKSVDGIASSPVQNLSLRGFLYDTKEYWRWGSGTRASASLVPLYKKVLPFVLASLQETKKCRYVDTCLMPQARRQLLKLARNEPGLFQTLMTVELEKKKPARDCWQYMCDLLCGDSSITNVDKLQVEALADRGFFSVHDFYSSNEGWRLRGRMQNIFRKALPVVMYVLQNHPLPLEGALGDTCDEQWLKEAMSDLRAQKRDQDDKKDV